MTALSGLRNNAALFAGAAALFAFLIVYEVHFVTVVNDMSEMNARMKKLSGSLSGVSSIGEMNKELKQLGPQLVTVNSQLRAVRRNTQAVTVLPRLEQRLAPISGEMRDLKSEIVLMRSAIGPLQPMASDLHGMRSAIGPLAPMAGDVRGMRGTIAELLAQIQALEGQMDEVRTHVRNIDRKTGPSPPSALSARPR